MCGIFGYITTDESKIQKRSVAEKLINLSQSRGTEASGCVWIKNNSVKLYKAPIKGSLFIHTEQFVSAFNSNCPIFIGHSRLATNGIETNNHNNQPVFKNDIICLHNGIVLNDMALWKKYKRHITKNLEVDTEIIPALFSFHNKTAENPIRAICSVYSELQGAASICISPINANFLLLATNTGSLYYGFLDPNSFVFASEAYILQQVMKASHIIHVPANTGVYVDYSLKNVHLFSLSENKTPVLHQDMNRKRKYLDISSYNQHRVYISKRNSLSHLETHTIDVRAIQKMKRCTRCIMPETMPLIEFDKDGVCNFCRSYKKATFRGIECLNRYVDQFRSKDGSPDCIVALSGGRDSSYGLHYAKTVLKLNPIAYTYDWGMVTDIARRNQSRMTSALGVEHIIVSADIQKKRNNIRKNIEAWLRKPDLGMVTLLMAGDKQAEYYAEELKRKTGIKLVLYCRGNQIEDERFKFGYYGIFDGTPKGVIHNLSLTGQTKMLSYYGKQFLQNQMYVNSSLLDTAWGYASAYLLKHDFLYLWHYIHWNENKIVKTLKQQYGWETPSDTIATWRIDDGTPAFYNYIYYHTQGFTEHDGLRSNQVREGIMSREQALRLVNEENKPRYEALAWYFNAIGLNGNGVLTKIDRIPTLY